MSPGPRTFPTTTLWRANTCLAYCRFDERRAVEKRMASDAGFASAGRFLAGGSRPSRTNAYQPETPPQGVKARIRRAPVCRSGKAGGRTVELACVPGAVWPLPRSPWPLPSAFSGQSCKARPIRPRPRRWWPNSALPGASVGLVAALDPESGAFSITPAAFSPDDGKSLELWLVPGEGAPVSALGLCPATADRLGARPGSDRTPDRRRAAGRQPRAPRRIAHRRADRSRGAVG